MANFIVKKIDNMASTFLGKAYDSFGQVAYSEYTNMLIGQLQVLYQEFIENYTKLNGMFNLNDPVDIFILYGYLLHNGYLSMDKKYEHKSQEIAEICGRYLSGSVIINGEGVCRHTAAMLRDILKNMGMEAFVLAVCERDISERMRIGIMENILGDHAITFAYRDEQVYYLDPTSKEIYGNDKDNRKLTSRAVGNMVVRMFDMPLFNEWDDYIKLRDKINGKYCPATEISEQELKESDVYRRVCLGNGDMFDKFYQDNRELYQEIVNVRKKIKLK